MKDTVNSATKDIIICISVKIRETVGHTVLSKLVLSSLAERTLEVYSKHKGAFLCQTVEKFFLYNQFLCHLKIFGNMKEIKPYSGIIVLRKYQLSHKHDYRRDYLLTQPNNLALFNILTCVFWMMHATRNQLEPFFLFLNLISSLITWLK